MPLVEVERYTRQDIRAHPNWLYVFGDNLKEQGFGGQAAQAGGETNNTVGVPIVGWRSRRLPKVRLEWSAGRANNSIKLRLLGFSKKIEGH